MRSQWPGELKPRVRDDRRGPRMTGNKVNNTISVSQETEDFKPLG
jgi:hypothetical protein